MIKETSRAAVRSQTQQKLLSDRAKIIDYIKDNSEIGCTRKEISHATGVPLYTVCWRIGDMLATEQVYIFGTKIHKETSKQACEALYWNFIEGEVA